MLVLSNKPNFVQNSRSPELSGAFYYQASSSSSPYLELAFLMEGKHFILSGVLVIHTLEYSPCVSWGLHESRTFTTYLIPIENTKELSGSNYVIINPWCLLEGLSSHPWVSVWIMELLSTPRNNIPDMMLDEMNYPRSCGKTIVSRENNRHLGQADQHSRYRQSP